MGLFGGSKSSSATTNNNNSKESNASNINEGGMNQNINFGSGDVGSLTVTDMGAIAGALEVADNYRNVASDTIGKAFSFAGQVQQSETQETLGGLTKLALVLGIAMVGVFYVKSR